MAGYKIPVLNGGLRKISDLNGPWLQLPCLITGGQSKGQRVKDHVFHVWLSGNSPPAVFAALQSRAGVAEPSPKRAGAKKSVTKG